MYGSTLDNETMSNYERRVETLQRQTEEICAVAPASLSGIFRRERITPVFENVREEIIADIGGLRLALMSYEDLVGPSTYGKTKAAFVEQVSRVIA